MATIKVPNAAQAADNAALLEYLTPIPPDEVPAAMDALHVSRGRNAACGCGECVEQFGDVKEVEGEFVIVDPPEGELDA